MKKAVFMRGMPGSGKSTYVRNNCAGACVCSADSYHMKKVRLPDGSVDEVYQWEPSRASLAHSNCLSDFISAISQNEPLVVVDNTNLRLWEIQNYLKLARLFGYLTNIPWQIVKDSI